uniref:Autophagy-related protein 2 n=1 Tax=Phlebotomus papatasi TaxID=29031 RepID=A0A1B0DI62_PHLPP
MEFQLHKVRFSHEVYPSDREQASRQVLLVSDLEIKDKLAVSNINKFLYHPTSGSIKPHQSRTNLIVIKALHLRSDLSLPAQECCLRVSMLPLRLNIDQDSLLFLFDFFQEFSGADSAPAPVQEGQRQVPPPMSPPPIMMVDLPEAAQELQARKMVSENLMLLMEEEAEKAATPTAADTEDNSPIYFRSVSFSPEVKIRIDYQGKRVELSRGPLAGLLMGLGQLHCSEIRLKRICHKNGILGVDKLLNFLLQEWLQDIKRNQLPSLLGGVGPMHSFIQLFQGIRDLFWLPIEQYQKDGQIVRGLQRGAQSFTARTALAALEITTRLIHLLQEERVIFCGQNEVAVTEDPIRIVDNHFSVPNRKPDLLQAPHDFPMAVIRYTLCEMSVTWHIFGGSDFGVNPPPAPKKDETVLQEADYDAYRLSYLPMSDVYKFGVSYAAGAKVMADGNVRPPPQYQFPDQHKQMHHLPSQTTQNHTTHESPHL